ncbi:serine hydrolase domain-containing protein [Flavobacterium rhizosphaerae]|uniref:Serine hydrolase domain-containing protein n=1 Tax=Flavobacterium rhizosphaerae TaxID=3163298 RepID=A0ABW8YT80_9FLAO
MNTFLRLCLLIISLHTTAQDIKTYADSLRKAADIPELAYAVVSSDTIYELKTIGYKRSDIQNNTTKAAIDDYFHLGSNTKAITGLIAGYLVEKDKIKWDTKFYSLFPEMKKESNPAYTNITLADLLSHRAKVQPYTSGEEFNLLPEFSGSKAQQRSLFVKYLLQQQPIQSNKLFDYSNGVYSAAALMLEKVSGKTWEELVDEILNQKLKLRYYIGWPNQKDLSQPWGHLIEDGNIMALPSDHPYKLNYIEPAGDISMPITDYAQLIRLNLEGLRGKDNFLKSQTYNYLHYGLSKYAIGWANTTDNNEQLSEHSGSAGTFFCYTLIDKKRNRAYIIIANSATPQAQKAIFILRDKLIEKYN